MGEISVGVFWNPRLWRFALSSAVIDGECASYMFQCFVVSIQLSVYA